MPLDSDLAHEGAGALVDQPERWPARIAALLDLMVDEITASGLVEGRGAARALALRVVTRLCHEYGGSREYWPRPRTIARVLRDAEIWGAHDGTVDGPRGIRMLAARHGLTDVQIWAILRTQRRLHRRRAPILPVPPKR